MEIIHGNYIRYLARSGTWHDLADLVPGTIWYLARSGIWYPYIYIYIHIYIHIYVYTHTYTTSMPMFHLGLPEHPVAEVSKLNSLFQINIPLKDMFHVPLKKRIPFLWMCRMYHSPHQVPGTMRYLARPGTIWYLARSGIWYLVSIYIYIYPNIYISMLHKW